MVWKISFGSRGFEREVLPSDGRLGWFWHDNRTDQDP